MKVLTKDKVLLTFTGCILHYCADMYALFSYPIITFVLYQLFCRFSLLYTIIGFIEIAAEINFNVVTIGKMFRNRKI